MHSLQRCAGICFGVLVRGLLGLFDLETSLFDGCDEGLLGCLGRVELNFGNLAGVADIGSFHAIDLEQSGADLLAARFAAHSGDLNFLGLFLGFSGEDGCGETEGGEASDDFTHNIFCTLIED